MTLSRTPCLPVTMVLHSPSKRHFPQQQARVRESYNTFIIMTPWPGVQGRSTCAVCRAVQCTCTDVSACTAACTRHWAISKTYDVSGKALTLHCDYDSSQQQVRGKHLFFFGKSHFKVFRLKFV